MKTQLTWRIAGGLFIGAAGLMAFLGASIDWAAWPLWGFMVYWGVFLLLFLLALYCVLLDLKYTAAQYAAMRRQVFRETLGDESFRRALRDSQRPESSGENRDN